ncbi:MAG TPA: alpha/beta hydrolase [Beijerinckiaceae bacterium]|nr:alpha/beta hydrolase [Beijerinckiaceae bacterium]
MQSWQDIQTTSKEGLRLYARRYGDPLADGLPVVCLPGISRNSADFHELAEHLAAGGTRAVYALDYRGRGRSDYDPDWRNYDIRVELGDVLDTLVALQVSEAVFVGTSRGGLITMVTPMLRPGLVKGAVLNDIGPVIDGKGLARIKSYVGKMPMPRTFREGGEILRQVSGAQFPKADEATWTRYAERTWKDDGKGGLVLQYDSNLLKTLENIDLEQPLPTLWPQFESLEHAPVLTVRGANSDILSQATAEEMTRRHPACALHVVPDEGHAPLLADAPTLRRIAEFLVETEKL